MLLQTSPTGTSTLTTPEERMFFIRCLEDRLQELCLQGLGGDLHFSKGQEAIPVGVMAALRPSDYAVTHHRTIAHAIAKGVPLRPLLAELLGKASGLNGGLAGEMHMTCPEMRFMFTFQLVGTCVPVAAGLAWAVKHHLKTDDIVVCFHGDAATANGQWHEGMNIAAVQKLPILFVCENNGVAGNVKADRYIPTEHVSQRAMAYGIEAQVVDGCDVDAVHGEASEAARYVRDRHLPFFLVCDTVRLGRHKQGMGDLRTQEELMILSRRDPMRSILIDRTREQRIRAEIDAAIEEVQGWPESALPQEG